MVALNIPSIPNYPIMFQFPLRCFSELVLFLAATFIKLWLAISLLKRRSPSSRRWNFTSLLPQHRPGFSSFKHRFELHAPPGGSSLHPSCNTESGFLSFKVHTAILILIWQHRMELNGPTVGHTSRNTDQGSYQYLRSRLYSLLSPQISR